VQAGLQPSKDAIAQESAKSPYVNLIAVREQDQNKPWVAKFLKLYQFEEIRTFVLTKFKGAVLVGF
jgi:D-methionine transport system substrate-binding protein